MNIFANAGYFLIQTIFDLYLFILLLRLVLQFFNVNYYNQLSQLVVKLTDPLVLPLRRILPRVKFIDLSVIILLLVIDLVKFYLLLAVSGNASPGIIVLMIVAVADIIKQLLNLFFFAILLNVILSWIAPAGAYSIMEVVYKISEPILAPIRRVMPPIAGFDLSPVVALIGLKLLSFLLMMPLLAMVQ